MIDCKFFYDTLVSHAVDFFTGVPDSLLKNFCAYVTDHVPPENHIIAANEGGGVALACGHYLATGSIGLVYMQNSGQGNAVNPLVSLADADVYSIPVLLLIGWRGEPGKKDEPQHVKQGKITLSLLDTLNIPYKILPDTNKETSQCVKEIFSIMTQNSTPAALVAKKGIFANYQLQHDQDLSEGLVREEAIKMVIDRLGPSDIVVSTTGKISREVYEYRNLAGDKGKDFLTVGSMGHCSQIALGISLAKPQRQVFCLDGDGAAIMHMGSLAISGAQKAKNYKHIIFNNGAHDSVGGQPTAGFSISMTDIAKACGYRMAEQAVTKDEVNDGIKLLKSMEGPALLEIRVRKGARVNLGRPTTFPKCNKISFMEFLAD
ncbi:MAG: phosphonopyruvate decarboxylase [Planctomycetes bacterium]|nr:phosphonopyruvate decarboxylase [Planctomycetota bacterium]